MDLFDKAIELFRNPPEGKSELIRPELDELRDQAIGTEKEMISRLYEALHPLEGLPVISDPLLQRFRIILLEIHDLHRVFERSSFDKIRATVERLNETHQICHVHANNTAPYYRLGDHLVPPVIELSYLRKDHLPKQQLQPAKYPHPLDQINEAKLPDPGTTKFWIP